MGTAPNQDRYSVLVVDDDAVLARALGRTLSSAGWLVTVVNDGGEAINALRDRRFDAMVLDVQMKRVSGFQVLEQLTDPEQIQDFLPRPAIIMLSGHLSVSRTVQAMRAGVADVLEKPVDGDELEERLRNAVANKRRDVAAAVLASVGEPHDLRDIERSLILRTFELCEGNLSLTARELGLPRTTVRDKLRRYGVQTPVERPSPAEEAPPAPKRARRTRPRERPARK